MTVYMRIHCDYCGGDWEVYDKDDYTTTAARTCPHCGTKVNKQTWLRQIVPAFGAAGDANRELIKDHLDHRPLFSVDIIADHHFKHNPYKFCPSIDLPFACFAPFAERSRGITPPALSVPPSYKTDCE